MVVGLDSVALAADRYRKAQEAALGARAQLLLALFQARRSGATLRELADASGLSYQRVAQLLNPGKEAR